VTTSARTSYVFLGQTDEHRHDDYRGYPQTRPTFRPIIRGTGSADTTTQPRSVDRAKPAIWRPQAVSGDNILHLTEWLFFLCNWRSEHTKPCKFVALYLFGG